MALVLATYEIWACFFSVYVCKVFFRSDYRSKYSTQVLCAAFCGAAYRPRSLLLASKSLVPLRRAKHRAVAAVLRLSSSSPTGHGLAVEVSNRESFRLLFSTYLLYFYDQCLLNRSRTTGERRL